jgi:hypothetical protein
VLPLALINIHVNGGSGDYKFALIDAPSGGLINEDTGSYLAGNQSDVVDVIEVTDERCSETITVEVEIVDFMEVLPSQPHVPRGQMLRFEIVGGSGEYTFSWINNRSGGELAADGTYYAGDVLGEDQIQVVDLRTEEVYEVRANVVTRIIVTVEPSMAWIPIGSKQSFQVNGGSGEYEFEWVAQRPSDTAPSLEVTSDQVTIDAIASGEGVLIARDRFLGIETSSPVQLLRSLQHEGIRSGKDHRESNLLAWPDQDGDGIDELIFATGEPDVDSAAEAGAVYIYSSATQEVIQRISSAERFARFGRQIAVGDWTGDGVSDLVVSAYLADRGATGDVGAAYLYEGLGDGTVNPEPRYKLLGSRGSAQGGTGLALCDFNGDGWRDLAVGAWLSEVPGQSATNQGVIYVYLGSEVGFYDDPDQIIGGQGLRRDGAALDWVAVPDQRMGYELDAGDIDGDGRCDLVASSYTTRGLLNIANTGEVHIYRGLEVLPEPLPRDVSGGLSAQPVIAITAQRSDGNGGRLGRRLLVLDRDADGRSEVVISQTRCDVGFNDTGAVYLYQWDTLPSEPATSYLTTADAQEIFRGTSGSEIFGYSLAAGDFDGDQDLDLAIGGYNGEVSGGPSNAGKLNLFLYDETSGSYETTPAHVMSGENASDNIGESVAILGVDHVASFAFGADVLGPNVGRPYWGTLVDDPEVEGRRIFELTALDYDADLGSGRFGISFDLTDYNSDGVIDVVAGASNLATDSTAVIRSGSGFVYQIADVNASATADADPLAPVQSLKSFRGHGGYDLLGEGARFIGDFDGDGWGDVALVARAEERPTNFGAQDTVDAQGCPSRQDNAGAVYIFRGLADGSFAAEPSFVIYGKLRNENLDKIDGNVDMNNDRRDDLIVGTRYIDIPGVGSDVGRGAIFLGRPAPTDGTRLVICEADAEIFGESGASRLGWSLSGLQDLNQDGCDEAIFGQPEIRVDG